MNSELKSASSVKTGKNFSAKRIELGYSIDVVMHVSVASSLCIIVFTSISSVLSHIKLNNVILLSDMLVWDQQLYVKLKHILP